MDKLEQAMQSEDFWIELADTSFGKVILHGKIQTVLQTMSIMRYQARLIRMEILLLLSLRLMRK